MSRRAGRLLIALACLLAAGGCSSAPTTARTTPQPPVLPRAFLGINSEDAFALGGDYRRTQIREQRRARLQTVRQTFAWDKIEPQPGRFELKTYDDYVADAARGGQAVLPILFGRPAWAAPLTAQPGSRATTPPADNAAFARFAAVLVRRYGPGGSLWRERPRLPRRPITAWQVWNEPNLDSYWGGAPDAGQYVAMLRAVAGQIRRADSRALVVTAGLPESRQGIGLRTYLRQLYRAGAQGSFDVLALNTYSKTENGVIAAIRQARRTLIAAEDGDKPIWLTEFGWATRPSPPSPMVVSRARQSALLAATITSVAEQRDQLGVQRMFWYGWRDALPYAGGKDFWGLHTGLKTQGAEPKPALAQLLWLTSRSR